VVGQRHFLAIIAARFGNLPGLAAAMIAVRHEWGFQTLFDCE
jgi:hypothetical protein